MKVNIVATENKWIVGRIIRELTQNNGWSVGGLDTSADINYFVTYQSFINIDVSQLKESKSLSAGFFTHPEGPEFFNIAKKMQIKISMAERYSTLINAYTIKPGVDSIFKPKLLLGVVGRSYPSGRKGENLLTSIEKLPYIEIQKFSTERIKKDSEYLENLRNFYYRIDALLITSSVEGGPIPAIEALACGTKVIAPNKLGNIENLPISLYENSNVESLKQLLQSLYQKKFETSESVKEFNWQFFTKRHLEIFEKYA